MKGFKDQNFQFFVDNYDIIYAKYGHKFIVIKDRRIIGAYDDVDIALNETLKTEKMGTFIVQECTGNDLAYQCSIMRLCIS